MGHKVYIFPILLGKRAQASASSRRKPGADIKSDAVLDGEPAAEVVPEPRQVRLVRGAHGVGAGREERVGERVEACARRVLPVVADDRVPVAEEGPARKSTSASSGGEEAAPPRHRAEGAMKTSDTGKGQAALRPGDVEPRRARAERRVVADRAAAAVAVPRER